MLTLRPDRPTPVVTLAWFEALEEAGSPPAHGPLCSEPAGRVQGCLSWTDHDQPRNTAWMVSTPGRCCVHGVCVPVTDVSVYQGALPWWIAGHQPAVVM